METGWGYAVIVDLVNSRQIDDRAAQHQELKHVLADVNRIVPAVQPLAPTVGDEMQGFYASLDAALYATLMLGVSAIECRVGIGVGDFQVIDDNAPLSIQDGSAWWTARAAIDETKRLQARRHPNLRTWFVSGPAVAEQGPSPSPEIVNAYLLVRDYLVTDMSPRTKRLMWSSLRGQTAQSYLAAQEGITQAGVSSNLRNTGASDILEGMRLMQKTWLPEGAVQ